MTTKTEAPDLPAVGIPVDWRVRPGGKNERDVMIKKIDLVKAIRDNPGCIAVIDNDAWWLWRDEDHRDSDDHENSATDFFHDRRLAAHGANVKSAGRCSTQRLATSYTLQRS